jgi:IstB-like ATP binding protein
VANYEQMSYRGLLAELLLAECDDRARRRSERRITAAKFPARSPYAASTSRRYPVRVKYTLATKLAHELVEAADEKTLSKTIARYGRGRSAVHRRTRVHAAGPPRRRAALSGPDRARGEASVAIASNESFSGWTKTFTDPRLCAAIVDRLTFGGTIIETGTDSYRLAQRTKLVNA